MPKFTQKAVIVFLNINAHKDDINTIKIDTFSIFNMNKNKFEKSLYKSEINIAEIRFPMLIKIVKEIILLIQ